MAGSAFLRRNIRQHVVKNIKSKKMDSDIDIAVATVIGLLSQQYPKLKFEHLKRILLIDLVQQLKRQFPKYAAQFATVHDSSYIRPDGGFLYAINKEGERRLVLVSEIKRQGTNDARALEGLPKQALGNAIERLGKNTIALRAMFKFEGVFPFVCFGSGHDFREESTIVDRVITINEFFPLNKIFVVKEYQPFEPCSLFFRQKAWTVDEMVQIMKIIADRVITYKFI